jgi:HAE1 family hydrophobic/amphiphilic exporter-1
LFLGLVLLAALTFMAGSLGKSVPTGFLPDEDQGYLYGALQLPNAASFQRTSAVAKEVEQVIQNTAGVQYVSSVVGYNMLSQANTTYNAFFFITLKDWEERKLPEEQYAAIKKHINKELSKISSGIAMVFPPPAIPGVGTSGGVSFILEDRAGKDVAFLAENVQKFIKAASERPELTGIFTTFIPSVPQMFVEVDQDKVIKQGVKLTDVYQTLQYYMGSGFINYFNRFGRQWQVYLASEGDYRTTTEQLGQFYVRNNSGTTVPLSALTSIHSIAGPEFTMRYNLYRSAQIMAAAKPGYSEDQAMKAMEEVFAATMPDDMGYDYIGMSYQSKIAQQGISPMVIFGFSLLCVFLILAAQYESWALPFSVLLSTPIAVFGAFFALKMGGYENNIYAQIGLVMLIGLAAKNAILIVEFAKMGVEEGKPLVEATLEGAKLRLRPILMTSFAFILGCVPLALATGAGGLSRQVIGFVVIGGMTAASVIAIFLIPLSFYLVEKITHRKKTVTLDKE